MILGSFFYTIYSNGKAVEWGRIIESLSFTTVVGNIYHSDSTIVINSSIVKKIENYNVVKYGTSANTGIYYARINSATQIEVRLWRGNLVKTLSNNQVMYTMNGYI